MLLYTCAYVCSYICVQLEKLRSDLFRAFQLDKCHSLCTEVYMSSFFQVAWPYSIHGMIDPYFSEAACPSGHAGGFTSIFKEDFIFILIMCILYILT